MTEKSQRQKSEKEWREELDEETYRVTREGGTEPAFSGEYWDEKAEGVYRCACCGEPLFSSDTKYESGTGWPSFWSVLDEGSVDEREDRKLASPRTEIVCSRCDAHLGHVFPDGPEPTGQRYCINSAALELERTEDD